MTEHELFLKNVALLSHDTTVDEESVPCATSSLPSVETLSEIVDLVKGLVFPGYFDERQEEGALREYHTGVKLERLSALLREQIRFAMRFQKADVTDATVAADTRALRFIDRLPELRRVIYTDVRAIFDNDPAAHTMSEVVFCYPVVQAMIHYRMAHELHTMDVPVLPRIITEMAHSATGIDIHPGATIGEYFSIDHGTGVVIGETTIIGHHVTLYQGVTLGARSIQGDPLRRDDDTPRHPVIEDRVTIYSNSTLLGRITIGHDTIIGGNVWVTHSVPPYSRILQSKALDVSYTDGAGI
ncbi:MAG: serine acetyltransferase [Prevotella sp.]|nr:serine acetyltransferase [Prevotella sp.]